MRHALLFAFLGTACTGSISGDGGPGSGTPPPPTSVQIVIRDGTTPQPNIPVIFEAADGTVISEVTTDATGQATAEMADGNVTVIRTYPISTDPNTPQRPAEATTYVGVKAGDRLALGNPSDDTSVASAINVKVPSGAGTVSVSAKCGAGQGTPPLVAMTVRNCESQVGLYVEDGDQSSFFTTTAYSENIDVSTLVLAGRLTSQISATNVTPGSNVSVEERLESEGWAFYTTGPQRVDGGPAQVNLPPVTGVDALSITTISNNNTTQIVSSRKPFSGGTTSVDGSVRPLASMDQPMFTPTTITWVEQTPGTTPDFVIASLSVAPANAPNSEYVRTIIAPYGGASLAVPLLGGAHTMYNPAMADQVGLSLGLATISGGYDAIRPSLLATASILEAAPMGTELTLSYTGGGLPGL